MAKYIFQSKTCLKSDIYANLITIMQTAGWQNITSSASVDGDVLYSTGEQDNLALCINMRSSNASGANDTAITDYNVLSYRFPGAYTPADAGIAGTFERTVAQEPWKIWYIAPQTATISMSTTVTLYYHCNKNRLIFTVVYPDASGVAPVLNYIGLPDEIYVTSSGSRDVIFGTSSGNGTANAVKICNAVIQMPSDTASSDRQTYVQLPPKQVNADGKVIMSEIFYGNPAEGLRGKMTGVFCISPTTPMINSGNKITIGTEQYIVFLCGSLSYNTFQTLYLAIQIA